MNRTATLLISFLLGCCAHAQGNLEIQSSLYYRIGGRRILVKRLPSSYAFQGKAVTRDGNILLAYEGEGGEPTTVLSIYDLRLKKERVLVELVTTPGATFSYDKQTDLVVFNWSGQDGLFAFSLDAARKIPNNLERLPEFKKCIVLVAKCQYCYEPRWTNDHRIEYLQWGDQGPLGTKYAEVPATLLKPSARAR
jgi:hypothetical protein